MRATEKRSRLFAKKLRSNMTDAEVILWSFIRRRALNGRKFRRQHPIGRYITDFACVSAKLVVEIDGATHWTEEELQHDARRTDYLRREGWRVLRVTNADVYDNLDGVWLTIESFLPSPAARPVELGFAPQFTGELSSVEDARLRGDDHPPIGPSGHFPRKRGKKEALK